MRDDGHVQTEFERERARVAEPPARDERAALAGGALLRYRVRVARRQLAERIEQRPIEIEREQLNHKSSNG
ncbi:MAG TPA: hypothetical protein VF527_16185 [Pyrinomonadaceae bacterium]